MRSRRFALILALAGAALAPGLGPGRALAATRLEGVPAEVRAGDRVEIRWSGLDPDVEEVELELSVAGSGWVRISPEMESLAGRYVWRVGGGLAGPAEIRLRAGGGRGEREVAARSFTIVPGAEPTPGAILEWPEGWDLDRCAGPAASGALAAAHERLSSLVEAPVAAVPSAAGLTHGGRLPPARATALTAAERPAGAGRAFQAPRRTPLRN